MIGLGTDHVAHIDRQTDRQTDIETRRLKFRKLQLEEEKEKFLFYTESHNRPRQIWFTNKNNGQEKKWL